MSTSQIELKIDEGHLVQAERFAREHGLTIEGLTADLIRVLSKDRAAAIEAHARLEHIFDEAAAFHGRRKTLREKIYRA